MRRSRLLAPTALLLAALLAMLLGAALFTDVLPGRLFPGLPLLQFRRSHTVSASVVTLDSIRELSELNTVEYVHRAVFPYDYLADGVSLPAVLRTLRTTRLTAREALTEAEYLYFSAFSLAEEAGLVAGDGFMRFVVVTLVLTAGVDLSAADVRVENSDSPQTAVVTLPGASITGVRVEDIDPSDYPYPDVPLSPAGWRRIARFVQSELVPQSELELLLAAADANARAFVAELLDQAGFAAVEFR